MKFVYYGEVKIEITIYCDERKRLETDPVDLDNCAKVICDAIKGPEGLLVDDSQIQSLSISWVDTVFSDHFDIKLNGHPDEFIRKPILLYEMPNGLYYPVSSAVGTEKRGGEQTFALLAAIHSSITSHLKFHQSLLSKAYKPSEAWDKSRGLLPILRGFPKVRVAESGFELVPIEAWTADKLFLEALKTFQR